MAKQQKSSQTRIVLPGVTNYAKLQNINNAKTKFNKFNPFVSQLYSEVANKNHEAESLDQRYLDENVYSQLLMMNGLRENTRTGKKSSYYGLSRKAKRQQLIRISIMDRIDEVLTKLTDEVVVNSQNKDAISLSIDSAILTCLNLDKQFIEDIEEYAQEQFDRIVKLYGFKQGGKSSSFWNKVYLFLIEGTQCYEIVWDDINNPKKIVGIHEIDALETEEFYVKGIKYWKHHKTLGRQENYIIMYDTQIVNIDWSEASPNNRMSYLEQLIKSHNDLRIMDESTLIWTVTNSVFRMLFKVPTKGKSRIAAAQSLATEKNRYNDDIQYNSDTGELNINGTANQMMMKTFWMAEGEAGSPEISTVGQDGPELNDMGRNEYFERRFYRAARMPYSRFDASSAESWNIDPRSQLRDEMTFGRFVTRIREIIQMLVLKPLYLQLAARYPEITGDEQILDAFKIRFNSYSVFEELMTLDIMNEKIEGISKINDAFVLTTPDGEDMKYFSIEFLINEYLPEMTKAKLELNAEMVAAEKEKLFQYQIKMYQLKAKYDPSYNIDAETGQVTDDMLQRTEEELDTKEDSTIDDEDKTTSKEAAKLAEEIGTEDTTETDSTNDSDNNEETED